eukprot:1203277-Pyramimonas_sp.AAC.1
MIACVSVLLGRSPRSDVGRLRDQFEILRPSTQGPDGGHPKARRLARGSEDGIAVAELAGNIPCADSSASKIEKIALWGRCQLQTGMP